jgi:hypothetical protein
MAVRLADQAFRLNDLGSLPRMASYTAAICEGDQERFRRISGLFLRDYPNNPAVLFDVAQRIILGTSAWSEGIALLERAYKLNPVSDSKVTARDYGDYDTAQTRRRRVGRFSGGLLLVNIFA